MRMSAINCWCSLLAADAGAAAPQSRSPMTTASSFCVIAHSLRSDHEMRPPVLRARGFGVRRVERKLFAVAHRPQPIAADPERHQVGARVDGAPLTQRQLVLGAPALVATTSD